MGQLAIESTAGASQKRRATGNHAAWDAKQCEGDE